MHNGFTITNTYEYEEVEENKETVNITVHKVWENNGHKIPESIIVSILANGLHKSSTELSAGNRWTHTFSNLDKYGANGKQIVYTIDEIRIPEGYLVDYTGNMKEGFIITNTYPLNDSVKESIYFTVVKNWRANTTQPQPIMVNLYANGKPIASTILNEENMWMHVFTHLDKYDSNGKTILYSVNEFRVPEGYVASYKQKRGILYLLQILISQVI